MKMAEAGLSHDQVVVAIVQAKVAHWTKWLALTTGMLAVSSIALAVIAALKG